MSHECNVPSGGGTKKYTWRCPVCRTKWTFEPKHRASMLFGDRNRDGSKPRLFGK